MSLIDYTALNCLKALPLPIQSRILNNINFQREVNINGVVAPIKEAGRIRLGDLLDAVRRVYDKECSTIIKNLDGDEVLLELHDHLVVIVRSGNQNYDKGSTPFEFALLSPDVNIRLETFEEISRQFGISGPPPSYWGPILEERPLLNDEISRIYDAIGHSVPNWLSITEDIISTHELKPNDLIPQNIEYFTTLCGPLPDGIGVDEYIIGPLADYRKKIMGHDILEGMSLLLPGSLRADASIVSALSEFSDEDVWNAANRLSNSSDPFTLLGLIEVALERRITKPEFEPLASTLVEKLCGKTLLRHDGMDIYIFFPSLVNLTLRNLRYIDGMMTHPPYWHWLCAFTQAGLITRLLDGLNFDPEKVSKWFSATKGISDTLADIFSIRSEPTWRFDLLTRDHIQAEIIGRLKGLAEKEGEIGRQFPNIDLLNKRIDDLMKIGASPFRPGPLEGNQRPKDRIEERTLPDNILADFLEILDETPNNFPWAHAENLSATFYLSDELRLEMTRILATIKLPEEDFIKRTNHLSIAALIAAVHQDQYLSEAVSDRLFQEFNGEDDVQLMFMILFISSAAFDDEHWLDWFKEKLHRLAYFTKSGPPLVILGSLISELKSLLPVSQWKFGQIEALCLSGPHNN